jgi:hypothetical protein
MRIRHVFPQFAISVISVLMVSCYPNIKQEPNRNGGTIGSGQDYVIGRYSCVDVNDGSPAGNCDITTRGDTCQAAYTAQSDFINSVGDACTHCGNVIDNSKRTSGPVTYIQGGPCSTSVRLSPLAPYPHTWSAGLLGSQESDSLQTILDSSVSESQEVLLAANFIRGLLPSDCSVSVGSNADDTSPRVINIDASPLKSSITDIKASLDGASAKNSAVGVESITKRLPINTKDKANVEDVQKLTTRGPLSFSNKSVTNDGEELELHFNDDRVGKITVDLPPHLSASISHPQKALRFTLSQPITIVLTGLQESRGIASNQRLVYIELNSTGVEYGFKSSLGETRLIIDMSKGTTSAPLQKTNAKQ